MKLGEKLRYLRLVEGTLRGLGREMSQQEIVRAMKKDLPVADREWLAPAPDEHDARATGEVFQGASRLSGG
jgi:hypothetical protein